MLGPTRSIAAHETDPIVLWPRHPRLSEERFQWKSKVKQKKVRSQVFDDTRTEMSGDASTQDDGYDSSTNPGSVVTREGNRSQSAPSVDSKPSKKKAKHRRVKKDNSESFKSETTVVLTEEATSGPVKSDYPYLVTLDCPLCCDPECVLNKAAKCPLLRHNEKDGSCCDECKFCGKNCKCADSRNNYYPVSGLVPRDENGVAVTLLKTNGGPIENSSEWATRSRWGVPSCVKWEHQVSEWISSKTQVQNKEGGLESRQKKTSKAKATKRKSRHNSVSTIVVSENATSAEQPSPESGQRDEMKMLVEGRGFKIYTRGQEKILMNYDRKNCKYLGCCCKSTGLADASTCGCGEWVGSEPHKCTKKEKRVSKKHRKVSLIRMTSHGYSDIANDYETKSVEPSAAELSKRSEPSPEDDKTEKHGIREDKKGGVTIESNEDNKGEKGLKSKLMIEPNEAGNGVSLTAKDVRNSSRAYILEFSLQALHGPDYREQVPVSMQRESCVLNEICYGEAIPVPCPVRTTENSGPCVCSQRCC